MSRIKILALMLLSLIIAGFLLAFITTENLIVDEEPVVSDIIIVPEGSNERASEAVTLLNKGYSSSGKIIVSPLTQSNSAYYVAAGAPAGSLLNDANATSTYTNARNTLQMMTDLGYDSAIITSSDYHMLRTKMIYERQNRHYGFDLTYVASYREIDGKNVQWNEGPSYLKAGGFREIKKFWGYVSFLYHWVDEE